MPEKDELTPANKAANLYTKEREQKAEEKRDGQREEKREGQDGQSGTQRDAASKLFEDAYKQKQDVKADPKLEVNAEQKQEPKQEANVERKPDEPPTVEQLKARTVQALVDKILAQQPYADSTADEANVRKKIAENKIGELTLAELRLALNLECNDKAFASQTGLKCTEEAFKRANNWVNQTVINAHIDLASTQLRVRPGSPVPLPDVPTDQANTTYAQRPETFAAFASNGQLNTKAVEELIRTGKLTQGLILDPKGVPGEQELTKLQNNYDWAIEAHDRLATNNLIIEANGRYQVMTEILKLNKPNWKPPEDPAKLHDYCNRADEVLNLIFRVRNYAEAINSLNSIDGDFKNQALAKDNFPGDVGFDEKTKRLNRMVLNLPDSLEATPENERVLQKLRDWLDKNSKEVDSVMREYEKGAFVRYGDVQTKGTVGLGDDGQVKTIVDEQGATVAVIKDGKLYQRSLLGELLDGDGKPAPKEVAEAVQSGKTEKFDYITSKFDVKTRDNGDIELSINKGYYGDHFANYQNWFGLHRGTITETRVYKPDDYVAVQTQTGKVQLVRADRLQEFKDVQAFFHHGSKIASAALDVGMIVSGSIGARAALQAGKTLYVATNVARVGLGVGGFLDPTFRQMGETGQAIRDFRHKAILFDVTQGLVRHGVGKLAGGKMLFETKAAAEVAAKIEASARMKQMDTATRYVFGAADAVWIPLLSTEIHDKLQRKRGEAPEQKIDKAYQNTGGGAGDSLSRGFARAGDSTTKPADATAGVFNVYNSTIGVTDEASKVAVKQRFDAAVGKLSASQAERDAYRNDELIKVFRPSGEQLLTAKKANNHAIPRDHKVTVREHAAAENEKVATAIALLTTAEKDGKLPEDGIIARRTVKVDGYTYQETRSSGESTYTVDIHVKPETIEQNVTISDAAKVLRDAALNSTSPGTRLVAADALFRLGLSDRKTPAADYGAVLCDILEKEAANGANFDVKSKALRQFSDVISLRKLEEASPQQSGSSYGLSSEQLEGKLKKYMKLEKDADLRAFAGAALYAAEFADGNEKVAAYFKQLQGSSAIKGAFRESVLKEMQTALQAPMTGTLEQLDKARLSRLRAARGLSNFDGAPDEPAMRKDIDKALIDCITLEDKSWYTRSAMERADLKVTMSVMNELVERMSQLDADQQKAVRKTALDVMSIPHSDVRPNATDKEKLAESQALQEAFAAKLMIAGQHEKIFGGNDNDVAVKAYKSSMATKVKEWLSREQIESGWGQYPEFRVAAIRTLGQLGDRTAVDLIAERLNVDTTKKGNEAFFERSPHVRTAAIDALYRLDESRFRKSPSNFQGPPRFLTADQKPIAGTQSFVENMLKYERDHAAVEMLYKIYDRSKRPDPESLDYADSVSKTVELLNNGSKIDTSNVVGWVQGNGNLSMVDQGKLDAEAMRRANSYLWSGFWGGLDQTFTSKSTEQARERQRADDTEKYSLRVDRDNQLASLTHFGDKFKSPEERAMAIKTLLYLVRNQDQSLVEQKDQPIIRERASAYLKQIALWQRDHKHEKDAVDNKLQLSQAIVSGLLDSSIDSSPEVKNNLLDALDALVSRDQGKVANEGGKADDYLIITPERAGAIISKALEREYKLMPADNKLKQENKALQLKMLEQLHALRYHGDYGVLTALSDPTFGSKHKEVQVRAAQVLGSLRDGTGWVHQDTHAASVGSLGQRADQMRTALESDDAKYNYENTIKTIFASCKQEPIKYSTDPRIAVLKSAIADSKSERVKLAAAWMLSQSANAEDIDAASAELARLTADASRSTTKSEAISILSSMVLSSSKPHAERAQKAWKAMYEQRKDKGYPIPPVVTDGKQVRLVPMQSSNGLKTYDFSPEQQTKDAILAVSGLSPADLEARLAVADYEIQEKRQPQVIFTQSAIKCHQNQNDRFSGPDLSSLSAAFDRDRRSNQFLMEAYIKDNKLTPEEQRKRLMQALEAAQAQAQPVRPFKASDDPTWEQVEARRRYVRDGKLETLRYQYGVNDRIIRAQGSRPDLALPRWQPAPLGTPAGK